MRKIKTNIIVMSLLTILLTTLSLYTKDAAAATVKLNITTNKKTYTLGEKIYFYANLTIDGTQIYDAIVALVVKDSRNDIILVRALNATTPNPTPLPVILLKEMYPCDAQGKLKTDFKRGSVFGVKVTINNTQGAAKNVVIFATLQFSDGTTMKSIKVFNETIPGNSESSFYMYPIATIPDTAPLGTAYFYGVALSELPENQGYAWCPEKITKITITSSSSSTSTATEAYGNYNASISTSTTGGLLGNYTVFASTFYNIWRIINQTKFEVKLVGDITGPYGVPDGKVDGIDMWRVAKDFGWVGPPGGKVSDVNKDGKVDGVDMWLVAKDFGKIGQYP